MDPDLDQERLSQQSSTPISGSMNLVNKEIWRSFSVQDASTPPMSPSTGIRRLSVNELKLRTAQRIAQTAIIHHPLRLDQQQQQQEYLAANENGMGEQLRRQYHAAGIVLSSRGSLPADPRRFQSAPGSLSADPRRFQSAPGSLPEPSTLQQAQQRVGIPHGLTVHELKAMTRARLAHCALVSNSNQVTPHEKAAASSVPHSAASRFSKETAPHSGSSHLYAPSPKQLQQFVENFQVHEQQQQLREVSRLENSRGSTSESATHYLCTTPSSQSANGSSPSRTKDCNIKMQTFTNQPHRMHQQVVPQHLSPSCTRATNSSVASRVSYLPDNANALMPLPIELDEAAKDVNSSFSLGDLPSNQPSTSSAALSSHTLPNNYWGKCLQYGPPFASSSSKVSSSDSTSPPWEPSAQKLAYQNHGSLPSYLPEGDMPSLCMAQSVAEFALLTPNGNDNDEQFHPPEEFTKLSELTGDVSWATQSLSDG